MGAYQLFIPKCRTISAESLKALGLSELIADGMPASAAVLDGPGDRCGGLICDWPTLSSLPKLKYDAKQQDWYPAPAQGDLPAGRYWVGVSKNDPVKPHDIARSKQYESEPAALADGNTWLLPVAAMLPRRWGLQENGTPGRNVAPEFADFCRQAEDIFAGIALTAEGDKSAVTVAAGWSFACSALALNYRVNPFIVSLLGLIDDVSCWKLWGAVLGFTQIKQVEDQKKTEQPTLTPATSDI